MTWAAFNGATLLVVIALVIIGIGLALRDTYSDVQDKEEDR